MVTPHLFASSCGTAPRWAGMVLQCITAGLILHGRCCRVVLQGRHCRVFAAPCDVSVYAWQGAVPAILASAPGSGLLCPCLQGPVQPQRHPLSHRRSLSMPCSQVVCSALPRPHLYPSVKITRNLKRKLGREKTPFLCLPEEPGVSRTTSRARSRLHTWLSPSSMQATLCNGGSQVRAFSQPLLISSLLLHIRHCLEAALKSLQKA